MFTLPEMNEAVRDLVDGELNFHFQNKSKTGVKRSRRIDKDGNFSLKNVKYSYNRETSEISFFSEESAKTVEVANQTSINKVPQSNFGINKRFSFLEKFAQMTISGVTASLLVSGEGGLGKSHTILEQLEKANLEEHVDYVIIKGYATPKALYATLYENLDKLVIFDDCDSVLKDPISLNILKGALDSYAKRTISWLSKGFITDELPSQFDFKGQVIFISNLPLNKIDGAVRSRTLSVDLSMTLEDKIDRMTNIIGDILPTYDLDLKLDVLSILDDKKEIATELNMRTLEKAVKVFKMYEGSEEGRDAIEYLLTNA